MNVRYFKRNKASKLLCLLAVIFSFSSISFSNGTSSVNSLKPLKSVHTERDLTSYVTDNHEVSKDLLTATITKSNTAPTSKFIQVTFSTPVPTGFHNSDNDFYSQITSEDYSGNYSDYKPGDNKAFDGQIIRILNKKRGTIYLASTMKYGSRFTITNKNITSDVMYNGGEEISYEGLNSIYVPKTYTSIEANAFRGCTDVDFYFEWNENDASHKVDPAFSSVPASKIHYLDSSDPAVFPQDKEYKSKFEISTSIPETLDGFSSTPFILNYQGYNTDNFNIPNLPLVYSYTMVGSDEIIYDEVELKSKVNNYDAVGREIVDVNYTIELTINFDLGQEVDTESLIFYDIHEAIWVTNLDKAKTDSKAGIYIPGTLNGKEFVEGTKYKVKASISSSCQSVDVNRVLTYQYGDLRKFSNYFTVSWNVGLVLPSYYEENEFGKAYMEQYASYFESGQYVIRHGLTSLSNTILNILYYNKDNTLVHKEVPIKTDDSIIEIWKEKGNIITFLISNDSVGVDFNINSIRSVQIDKVTVTMDIYDKTGNQKVKSTSVDVKFGSLDIMSRHSRTPSYMSVDLIIILTFAIFIPLYCAIALGLFFYMKNKFKNDEFRRVKPKQFFKKALIGLLGGCVVVGMIIFIIARFTLFSNTIAVYNPLDIFVVFFSLVGIVVTGLFIRAFIVMIKTAKERRETMRLHLNDDAEDDGTK